MNLSKNKVFSKIKRAFYNRNPIIRRLQTKNYSIKKVAIGESNDYNFPSDWIKIDYIRADYNIDLNSDYSLPFEDSSKSMIYSAHCIEHLTIEKSKYIFQECYRILEKGGKLRVEVPDAEKLIQMYKDRDSQYLSHFHDFYATLVEKHNFPKKYQEEHLGMMGTISNYIPKDPMFQIPVYVSQEECDAKLEELNIDEFCEWCISLQTSEQYSTAGHKSYFYFDRMKKILEGSGFKSVTKVDFNQTNFSDLKLNNGQKSINEKPHRAFFSLFVEAEK